MPSSTSVFSQVLRHPRATGALAAACPFLARAMADALPCVAPRVVELGPGPGAVTSALLERGLGKEGFLALEVNPRFASSMKQRFPGVQTLATDARYLPFALRDMGWPGQVDAIVSSLPLLSMAARVRQEVLEAIHQALGPQGCFVQYTYGPRSPVSALDRARFGWEEEHVTTVWKNLPPANVFRFRPHATPSQWPVLR